MTFPNIFLSFGNWFNSTDAEQHNFNNSCINALQIALIAEEVVKYLRFEEINSLGLVSKTLHEAICATKTFSDHRRFRICEDDEEILNNTDFLWNHLYLNVSKIPIERIDLIGDLLEFAKSIYISFIPAYNLQTVNVERTANSLAEVLKKTKRLRELELDFTLLKTQDVFSIVEVQEMLSQLKGLRIRYEFPDIEFPNEETALLQNLNQLSLLPWGLQKFAFEKNYHRMNNDFQVPLRLMVEASAQTLVHLELHGKVWMQEEIRRIHCPGLKRLVLSISTPCEVENQNCADNMEAFIINQPPLEELDIEIERFPFALLLALSPRLTNLRKLCIKADDFVGHPRPQDWTFLGTIRQLKSFYLKNCSWLTRDLFVKDIVKELPPSTTGISIYSIELFWRGNNELQYRERNIGRLVNRFRNLTSLDLIHTLEAINDIGMQTLIQTCPKLTKLTFSGCLDLTNFGVSGIRKSVKWLWREVVEENSGVSLTNLRDLTQLKIRSICITPECILDVLKFDRLRVFDYFPGIGGPLDKDFIFRLLRQNKFLEKLGPMIRDSLVRRYENVNVAWLEKEMKTLNPRAKLLLNYD